MKVNTYLQPIIHFWQKNRKWINVAGILIGCLVFILQIIQSTQSIKNTEIVFSEPVYLLLAVVCGLIAYLIQIRIWQMVLKMIGYQIPFSKLFAGYNLSFLPRYIPGTIWGYASRNEWMKQNFSVPHSYTNYASIIEVIGPVIASSVIACLYFSFQQSQTIYSLLFLFLAGLIPAAFGLFLTLLPSIPFAQSFWQRIANSKLPKVNFIDWLFMEMVYLVQLFFYGGMVLFILLALQPEPRYLSFSGIFGATFAYSAAWSIGFLILFIPSGIGVRETIMTLLLQYALGVSAAFSLLVTVADRLFLLITELILILISVIPYLIQENRKKTRNNTNGL